MTENMKQVLFNKVVTHLFHQGERAISEDGKYCVYQRKKGRRVLKCAIGSIIEPKKYRPEIEKANVLALLRKCPEVIPKPYRKYDLFLRDLQYAHDDENYWLSEDAMKTCLRGLARRHEVDDSILDDLHFPAK
jgi:hypothetical protein